MEDGRDIVPLMKDIEASVPVVEAEIIDDKPNPKALTTAPWTTVLVKTLPTSANETELRECPPEFMVELKVPTEWLDRAQRLATPPKRDPYSGSWKAFEQNRKKEFVIKVRFGGGDIDLVLEHRAT